MLCRIPHLLALASLVIGCSREAASDHNEVDAFMPPAESPANVGATESSAKNPSLPGPAVSAASANTPPSETNTDESGERFCDVEHPEIPSPDNRIYATWQSIRVPLGAGLGTGTLRVLEDSRITRKGDRPYLGTHPVLPPCALLDARLELLNSAGEPIQSEKLWPQVDIVVHQMGPDAVIYEAIESIRCIASCWCGDGHSFWRVENGKLITHQAHLVQKSPTWTKPFLGTMVPAAHVTHGCYSTSQFKRNSQGFEELIIDRAAMGGGRADEHYWFENGEWRASMKQWR